MRVQMKIGYPCINRTLACQGDRTFRLKSYSDTRFRETVENNIACLKSILKFNGAHGILFFRITSELVPFASHEICTIAWQQEFSEKLGFLGRYIQSKDMRISMHPDQYCVINSPDEGIVRRSVAELLYHCDLLDAMGLDRTAKIQIHAGGVYGKRHESMKRFVASYGALDERLKRRLVIENDDRSYPAEDCIALSRETTVPVVFDIFHHQLLNRGEAVPQIMEACASTWHLQDGPLMVDYSSQEPGKRQGAHAQSLDAEDFASFLATIKGLDFDLMLEIKDKEKSALRAIDLVASFDRQ
jgi:UV DNA damage endonuclease